MKRVSIHLNAITNQPPKRRKLKSILNARARLVFMEFVFDSEEFLGMDIFHRTLLINHNYLDLLFKLPESFGESKSMHIKVNDVSIGLEDILDGNSAKFYSHNNRSLFSLLRIAHFEELSLKIGQERRNYLNEDMIFEYVRFCKVLKENKSLKRIIVQLEMLDVKSAQFFMEHLDKIHYLSTVIDVSVILKQKTMIMEGLKISCYSKNPYFHQIFKVKAKHIDLISSYWKLFYHRNVYLWQFVKYGPFLPNPTIESLKIIVDFGVFYFMERGNSPEWKWENRFLPKNKLALRYLKELNPEIQLKIYSGSCVRTAKNVSEIVSRLNKVFNRAKLIIDFAKEIGIKIEYIRLMNGVIFVRNEDSFENFCEQIADQINMTYEDEEINDSIEYNGVIIELNQRFQRDIPYVNLS